MVLGRPSGLPGRSQAAPRRLGSSHGPPRVPPTCSQGAPMALPWHLQNLQKPLVFTVFSRGGPRVHSECCQALPRTLPGWLPGGFQTVRELPRCSQGAPKVVLGRPSELPGSSQAAPRRLGSSQGAPRVPPTCSQGALMALPLHLQNLQKPLVFTVFSRGGLPSGLVRLPG